VIWRLDDGFDGMMMTALNELNEKGVMAAQVARRACLSCGKSTRICLEFKRFGTVSLGTTFALTGYMPRTMRQP
jgi:hypothetical protein